ncbi:MAG: hypothetical protein F6K62_16435 [Sphaerospermopsis sp. SIO1G2]|nr:hypothetical protein [Sphaerospermopsis sp. SIO1G2]
MAKSKNEVAETSANDVALYDYGEEYAGAGTEEQSAADTSIPFLKIGQTLTPQVRDRKLEEGEFFNSVTEEVYGSDVTFVPVYTRNVYVKWKPERGGYLGELPIESPEVKVAVANAKKFNEVKDAEGNDLEETFYVWGLLVTDVDSGDAEPIVMAFTSTQIKAYRKMNTSLLGAKGASKRPLFANLITWSSEKREKGNNVWYTPKMSPAKGDVLDSLLPPGHPLLEMAKGLYELVKKGEAQANYESSREESVKDADVADPSEAPF